MHVMCAQESAHHLRGKVQIDDAYLGGERIGNEADCGSSNKVPIVAAASIDDAGHPMHVKLATMRTFSFAAIADRTQLALARGFEVISDGLACSRAGAEVGCVHQPVIAKGRHPMTCPSFAGKTLHPAT